MAVKERRERERAERRQLILRSARELAEAEGWEAVTTRRLADRVEYSQPVLYSHFAGKDAIVAAVAVEGFAELAAELRTARAGAGRADAALRAVADSYVEFARTHPALYDAMFAQPVGLTFGTGESPAAAREAFDELRTALLSVVAGHDLESLTEVFWSSLHGLVSLGRGHRLRVDHAAARLDILVDYVASPHGHRTGPPP
ncbi:TetR/AcrR family transcriptional regulator [Actinoplanes sp. NPDC049599]|uniref:TetR/AcrR family transcriptional regulator n=1 Tax=Actinoplanes sp. NPDC049599 TaxID=3363903 RepID=UPI0037B9ACED